MYKRWMAIQYKSDISVSGKCALICGVFRHGVGAPVVGEIEGDYRYDHKRSLLEWQLPVIDESNKSGAMEFSISGHPDDFFPINVSFGSTKSFCDLKVNVVIYRVLAFYLLLEGDYNFSSQGQNLKFILGGHFLLIIELGTLPFPKCFQLSTSFK